MIKSFDAKIFFLLLRPMRITPNTIVLTLVSVLCSAIAFAAPNPPQPIPPSPPGEPIDGGLIFLIIAATILGFYKLYKTKKASI